jgi:hypothetical protein
MSHHKEVENQTGLHAESTRLLAELLKDAVHLTKVSSQHVSTHRLGAVTCRIASNDAGAGQRLTRCLMPVSAETTGTPVLEIFVLCGSSAPFSLPPAWNLPHTSERHLERLHLSPDVRISAFYDHDRKFWMILDKSAGQALFWIASSDDIPFWEEAAPFKSILHWYVAGTALTILHGALVTASGRGVILGGPGGSGKSTTVAACLQEGLGVGGDDLVMIERGESGWRGHALYDAVKLSADEGMPVPPILASAPSRQCGTKRLVRYSDAASDRFVAMSPLIALVQCVITGRSVSALTPIAPPAMLRALAPPTAFLLRGREADTLGKIGALVRELPCFRLDLGKDPGEAASFLQSWLTETNH